MSIFCRHVLIFFLPLLAALVLSYSTLPLLTDARKQASEIIEPAMSGNSDAQDWLSKLRDSDLQSTSRTLDLLAHGTILLVGVVSALLTPAHCASERKANLLTTMVVSLGFAHLVIRFGTLHWHEFGLWVIFSVIAALAVMGSKILLFPHRQKRA